MKTRAKRTLLVLVLSCVGAVVFSLSGSYSSYPSRPTVELALTQRSIEEGSEFLSFRGHRSQLVELQPTPQGARRVRVVDDNDGQPVVGARVLTWDGQRVPPTDAKRTETNEEGIADFFLVAPFEHLAVEADGWFPKSVPIQASGEEQLVRLRPAGTLRVRVVGEENDPIERAFVQVFPSDLSALPSLWPVFSYLNDSTFDSPLSVRSVTNCEGFVEIGPLPCDLPLRAEASIVVPESSVETMIPGESRWAEVQVKAPAHGCLRGRVLWSDGTPADVGIQPLVGRYPEHNRTSSTGASGDFVLCGLPLGAVRWRIHSAGEPVRVAEIREGEDTDIGTIEIPLQGRLFGRVHTRSGNYECMPGLQLGLAQGGRSQGKCRLSSEGDFDLTAPLGENWYQLSTEQGVLTSGSVFAPGSLALQLEDFSGGFEFRSPPPRSWSSLVLLDMQRGPGSGVDLDGNSPLITWTEDGICRVFPVLLGSYEVHARTPSGFNRMGTVEIAAGTMAKLNPSFLSPASLTVFVHDVKGIPVGGVPVVATPRRGGEFVPYLGERGSTEVDGRVKLVLGPGDWRVAVHWPAEREELTRLLTLDSGADDELQLCVSAGSVIRGKLTWGGTPVENGRVVAFPRSGAEVGLNVYETQTDIDGLFDFVGLAPGTWVVDVSARDARGLRTFSREVLLQEAPEILEFDLTEQDQRVRVTYHGTPLQGVSRIVAHSRERRVSRQFMRGEEPRLALEPGAYVFLVASDNTAYFHKDFEQFTYWVAPSTTVVSGAPVDVAIAGREVRVQCTASDGDRPMLRLVSLAGIDLGSTSVGPLVTYEDQGEERVFPDIPVGSVIQLEGWDPTVGLRTKTLTVHANSLGPVIWPPH